MDFLDADHLPGEDGAEVNLFLRLKQIRPQLVDDHDFDMEGIIDIRQSHVGAGGGLIGRILHAQDFMRVLIVEDVDKVIELGLLLQEV